ncbi:MAG: NADH-quinone oxidoreductase subunit NuoE [Deltaproteobacteria bacterium]|nr:NADH-quinone oxidoreductase subunit NuoE [Deltaproteobacteria bacterium]
MSKIGEGTNPQSQEKRDLLVLLERAQSRSGYLSKRTIAELAESLGLSIGEVYGVASFYSFLSIKPQGRNVIRICKSLPCYLKNAQTIIEGVRKEIGINPGETTADGRFSFELTNCIGACDKAPAMMVNDDVHGDLTPKKISKILQAYK